MLSLENDEIRLLNMFGKEELDCPKCGSTNIERIKNRKNFRCKGCRKQFSITSGTIFAYRKMSVSICISAWELLEKSVGPSSISKILSIQYVSAARLVKKYKTYKVLNTRKGQE